MAWAFIFPCALKEVALFKGLPYNEAMNSKTLLLLGLLVWVIPGFAGGEREAEKKALPGYTGIVHYLEGNVSMDGESLAIGDTVDPGSTLTTGEDSYCEVVFGGKNVFRILESTVAVIDLERGRGNIRVDRGSMAFLLKRLSALDAEEPEFLVDTPSAAFGVRGTAFFVALESPASSYVCACNGSLQVEDAAGGNIQELTGYHHKALRIKKTGDGTFEFSAPGLLYHDDEDMNNLAKSIDETIPWGSREY